MHVSVMEVLTPTHVKHDIELEPNFFRKSFQQHICFEVTWCHVLPYRATLELCMLFSVFNFKLFFIDSDFSRFTDQEASFLSSFPALLPFYCFQPKKN